MSAPAEHGLSGAERRLAYSRADVKLCGSCDGASMGEDGPSQMGFEDLAIVRPRPDCIMLYPADTFWAEVCVAELAAGRGAGRKMSVTRFYAKSSSRRFRLLRSGRPGSVLRSLLLFAGLGLLVMLPSRYARPEAGQTVREADSVAPGSETGSAELQNASPGRRSRQAALKGKVTAVYDGDTVRVRLESGEDKRVRFIGVDSPELDDNREKVRLMAFLSRRFTFHNLYGRSVTLSFDREREDSYGRLLAYVLTEDGRLFNELLVREGFASAYLKFPFDEAVRKKLKEAEAQARRTSSGLWQPEPFPQIDPGAVAVSVGKLVTVRFRCVGTMKRSGFLVLRPERGGFEVLVQRSTLAALSGDTDFKGRTLRVVGFVELFRGRPQVVVGLASQLAVVAGPAR